MTIKEWRDANLECFCNANNIYEFSCSPSHESDLPTDVKGGSTALVSDGTSTKYLRLRIENGVATWFPL